MSAASRSPHVVGEVDVACTLSALSTITDTVMLSSVAEVADDQSIGVELVIEVGGGDAPSSPVVIIIRG